MSNVLDDTTQQQIHALGRLGWTLSRIQQTTGVRRETTFDNRRTEADRKTTALTFRQFAGIYKERHVFAKTLAIGKTIDYRLKPIDTEVRNQQLENLQAAAARLERGEKFDPSPGDSGSPSIRQVVVKSDADRGEDKHADSRARNAH